MGATIRDLGPAAVKEFRARHGLTKQSDLAYLFGTATNNGTSRAVVRWETEGAQPYVRILIAYADRFGLDVFREEAAKRAKSPFTTRVEPEDVLAFRKRHEIKTQPMLDHLFGFLSGGRSTRAWEANGAPAYVGLIFKLVDTYGIDLLRQVAAERDEERKAA